MQAESPSSPQDSADIDDEELRRVLAASEAFDDDLLALLRAGWNMSSLRISRHRGHPFHGIADSVSRQGGHRFTLIADSVSA